MYKRQELHSSTHQLMRLVECITGCQGKQTTAIFLDVEKAFVHVWHEGVLYKLTEVLPPDYYVHLIGSFLRYRCFRVRIDYAVSCLLYTSRCV